MKRPPRALQAEWAAKLRASGFEDLEAPMLPNGGRMSHRGMPTPSGPTKTQPTPEDRIELEAERDGARDALRFFRFASRQDREVWALHVEGLPFTGIGPRVGLSYRKTREAVLRIKAAIREDSRTGVNQVNQGRGALRKKLDRLIQRIDVELLAALAGAVP